ncbi:unnamed protein product [Paramecium pentaurelia]|uniref:Uncharacterized protein n=1 Tax=Paramecium pentaurelia TaxID=43138 RepID=A0A8S1U4H4_9CILI|nr:unnamed protein product [Paramecium pentaurelia]
MLNTTSNQILQGQYGCDHSSRLEKVQENQLNFYLNYSHHEYMIVLSIKSHLIPVILQKLKENCREIEIIFLGYISSPIEDSDHDALLQKVISEILNQSEEGLKLDTSKKVTLTYYKEDL